MKRIVWQTRLTPEESNKVTDYRKALSGSSGLPVSESESIRMLVLAGLEALSPFKHKKASA